MKDRTIHGQVAAHAAAAPHATAVVCRGRSLTYGELDRRARSLARRLRRLAVGPETLVAVLLERSLDLPVALLGILEAGGAYLPLDPSLPPGRLAQLLAGARPAAVLLHRSLARRLPPRAAPLLLYADDLLDGAADPAHPADDAVAAHPADPATPVTPVTDAVAPPAIRGPAGDGRPQAAAEGLACVLPAMGASGGPRSMMISHGNVADFFAAIDRRLGAAATGTWLAASDLAFDLSALELLWTLCRGFRLVLHAEREPVRGAASAAVGTVAAVGAVGTVAAVAAAPHEVDFSLFYFGSYAAGNAADHYRLVLEGARFADRHGFSAVWTPERHFHEFGGLFPNPAVLGAAIAASTERLQIRAGSVVLPLHDPLRVAEEWALVDNLSGGRVGVSFASGWHANDFVLKPGAYQDRQEIMRQGIDTVRRLWRGEPLRLPSGAGNEVEVRIFPRPVQAELPVWVTAAGSPATFRLAGELGAGVLTHLLGQETGEFADKIKIYREAWRAAGHGPGAGRVTVMLHTFVGATLEAVHASVREPLGAYLKTSFGLLRSLAASIGLERDPRQLAPAELDLLVSRAYERYVAEGGGLIGTPATCAGTVERLRQMGVDEVACLIDFGVAADQVLAALAHLDELRRGATHRPASGDPYLVPAAAAAEAGAPGGAPPGPAAAARAFAAAALAVFGRTATKAGSSAGKARAEVEPEHLGSLLDGEQVHLLDAGMQPVAAGAAGEIYVGGGGVGRGYLGRADLTAERFVPDPWSRRPGARLYRTGDFARRLSGLG